MNPGGAVCALFGVFALHAAPPPALEDLPLVDSLEDSGVTWHFENPVRAGRFVNGDHYVVGAATVVSIDPPPREGRNGSVLNLPLDNGISGFDSRVSSNRFRESLRETLPVVLGPGDALISSISIDDFGEYSAWLRSSDTPVSPVASVSVLTCLEKPVAAGAFRPSYCDRGQRIYYADSLRWDLLPSLAKVPSTPSIDEFASHFEQPWLDVCFFHFDAAIAYQPAYGREHGRAVGMAALLLTLDFSKSEKERLCINLVQNGIDLWGIARAGYEGWPAHGGHGTGRKLPMVFAGTMLAEGEMASPTRSLPGLRFGEDLQTMYDSCWTGADVVYAGHQGVWNGEPVNTSDPEWGPYEHLHPSQWPGKLGESYRRCCTSLAWVGQALAVRIMQARDNWNHPAFFDYVDRWMTEEDSGHVAVILEERGWDYTAGWARQRQCWDDFVEEMWEEYRGNLPDSPVRRGEPAEAPGRGRLRIGGGRGVRVAEMRRFLDDGPGGRVKLYNGRGRQLASFGAGARSAHGAFPTGADLPARGVLFVTIEYPGGGEEAGRIAMW